MSLSRNMKMLYKGRSIYSAIAYPITAFLALGGGIGGYLVTPCPSEERDKMRRALAIAQRNVVKAEKVADSLK